MTWLYSVLFWFCTVFGIRCNRPRLPSGTASMAPQVIRDRLEHLHCERYRYHQGPCEAKRFMIDPQDEDDGGEKWQ